MGGEENRFIFPFPRLIPPSTQKHRRRCQSPSSSPFLPIQSCGSVDFLSQALMPYDSPAIRPPGRATYRTLPSLRRCFSQHFLVAFQQSREKVHPQSSGQVPKWGERIIKSQVTNLLASTTQSKTVCHTTQFL